jgi:hypothetical protein
VTDQYVVEAYQTLSSTETFGTHCWIETENEGPDAHPNEPTSIQFPVLGQLALSMRPMHCLPDDGLEVIMLGRFPVHYIFYSHLI